MNNELYHYGVLGMKWGIRRYQPYSIAPRGSGKRGKEIGEAASAKTTNKARIKEQKAQNKAVRKQARADNRKAKQLNRSEKYDRSRDLNNRKILSDEELKRKIQRLRDEKTLRELTEQEVHPGRTWIKDMASDIIKDTVKDVTKAAVQQALKGKIRKVLGDETVSFKEDLATSLKPKKK